MRTRDFKGQKWLFFLPRSRLRPCSWDESCLFKFMDDPIKQKKLVPVGAIRQRFYVIGSYWQNASVWRTDGRTDVEHADDNSAVARNSLMCTNAPWTYTFRSHSRRRRRPPGLLIMVMMMIIIIALEIVDAVSIITRTSAEEGGFVFGTVFVYDSLSAISQKNYKQSLTKLSWRGESGWNIKQLDVGGDSMTPFPIMPRFFTVFVIFLSVVSGNHTAVGWMRWLRRGRCCAQMELSTCRVQAYRLHTQLV